MLAFRPTFCASNSCTVSPGKVCCGYVWLRHLRQQTDSLSLPAPLPANRWTVTKGYLSQLSFKFFEMKWSQVSQVVQTLDFEIFFVEVPPTCCSWLRTWHHAEEPDVRNAHVAAMFAKGTEGNGNCACFSHPRLGDSLVEEPYSMILGRLNSLGLIVVGLNWLKHQPCLLITAERPCQNFKRPFLDQPSRVANTFRNSGLAFCSPNVSTLRGSYAECEGWGSFRVLDLISGFWLRQLAQEFPFEVSMSIWTPHAHAKCASALVSSEGLFFWRAVLASWAMSTFCGNGGTLDILISGMSFSVTGETSAGRDRNERWFRMSFFVTSAVFAALGRRLETFVLWNCCLKKLVHDDFAWQPQYLGFLRCIFLLGAVFCRRKTLQT